MPWLPNKCVIHHRHWKLLFAVHCGSVQKVSPEMQTLETRQVACSLIAIFKNQVN